MLRYSLSGRTSDIPIVTLRKQAIKIQRVELTMFRVKKKGKSIILEFYAISHDRRRAIRHIDIEDLSMFSQYHITSSGQHIHNIL